MLDEANESGPVCCTRPPVIHTFSAVHMRTAYLVHQQHEDEAQHQRHADAGVKLLVTVLVFPAGGQNRFCFTLRLGHFHDTGLAVAVVSACRKTDRERDTAEISRDTPVKLLFD